MYKTSSYNPGSAPLVVVIVFLALIFGSLFIEGNPAVRFRIQQFITEHTGWDPDKSARKIANRKWDAEDANQCALAVIWVSEIASEIDRDNDGVIGDPRPNSAYSIIHMSKGEAFHTLNETKCSKAAG